MPPQGTHTNEPRQAEDSGGACAPEDLLVASYDYDLPPELIAVCPAERREHSRLLVVPPVPALPQHRHFYDLPDLLRPGDVLVLNDSRVLPARLFGRRAGGGGGLCEVLLLDPQEPGPGAVERWSCFVRPGKKIRQGTRLEFAPGFAATVESVLEGGERVLAFECDGPLRETLERHGSMPLPPYILARRGERTSRPEDRERYQTVYAERDGSVAAPTAGLHFTSELLERLGPQGVEVLRVTLHVGAGTFRPITADRIDEHRMHVESYDISQETAQQLTRARREGRRIVAVGTTTVRTLESSTDTHGVVRAGANATALMIRPGHRFRLVDALITNFHLPRSTLMCLVAAMIGRQRLLDVYAEAIREKYRFYSYGDAMFIPQIEGAARTPNSTD